MCVRVQVIIVCLFVCLSRFSSSDALLAHFLSFSTSPSHYSLSHSVQDGLPLFYFPPNSSKPLPSPGINTSGGK